MQSRQITGGEYRAVEIFMMPMPEQHRPKSADAALEPPVQTECNFEDDER